MTVMASEGHNLFGRSRMQAVQCFGNDTRCAMQDSKSCHVSQKEVVG